MAAKGAKRTCAGPATDFGSPPQSGPSRPERRPHPSGFGFQPESRSASPASGERAQDVILLPYGFLPSAWTRDPRRRPDPDAVALALVGGAAASGGRPRSGPAVARHPPDSRLTDRA